MIDYPITPPPELVEQWTIAALGAKDWLGGYNLELIATQAARWGADTELEACCVWLRGNDPYEHDYHQMLRTARRPKPPSLKEQALLAIDTAVADGRLSPDVSNVVRRALEQLDD